jgi:hypothetical protein
MAVFLVSATNKANHLVFKDHVQEDEIGQANSQMAAQIWQNKMHDSAIATAKEFYLDVTGEEPPADWRWQSTLA